MKYVGVCLGFFFLCKKKNYKMLEILSLNVVKFFYFCFIEVLIVEVVKLFIWYKIFIGEFLFLKSLNMIVDNCFRNRIRIIV